MVRALLYREVRRHGPVQENSTKKMSRKPACSALSYGAAYCCSPPLRYSFQHHGHERQQSEVNLNLTIVGSSTVILSFTAAGISRRVDNKRRTALSTETYAPLVPKIATYIQYQMKQRAEGGGIMMTEEQQSWMKTQLIMNRLRPLKRLNPPGNPLGNWCFRLTQRKWFDLVVMSCIALNTVIMAMEFFGQGHTYTR